MRKFFSLLPGFGFFIYFTSTLDELKLSSLMGVLAVTFGVNSVGYFHFNAPEGRRETETAFGITGRYRNPMHGTIIPAKNAAIVIGSIVLACLLGLLFHHYGY